MPGSNSSHDSADDPLWYKDAIIYELHIRAFSDSDGDGIGDLKGLIEKLDYLQNLGVTALWLLPFYTSPLRDDGYDIADYRSVHPPYGAVRDFQALLREAHRRGLRVITELVLNHTSDQHGWFQRSRRAPAGSRWRRFYVWSDDPDRYKDVRIIFRDFESSNWTWDQVAHAYYWHRFYSHQPDLNFDSPDVRRAMLGAVDFWLGMGVDGLRLDAVPYLYEREGTTCENLPETHAFLKELRKHVDAKFPNRMLLAEANQWPEDAAAYFGHGDECHMAFHFPLMPRMFMAIHAENSFPVTDIFAETPSIPESCQWALFLRNHDELTLEMVTDEERDYMYRTYAKDSEARINLGIRHRLAPLLGNNRRKVELMQALLFSLPGTPVIYYGDEIGMGDNIYLGDRNGVRTPMQWSSDRNAGFSKANAQRLYLPVIVDPEHHYETVNVEAQLNNTHSFLWWMKRLIALRRRHKSLSRGAIQFLPSENHKILAFVRQHGDERLLVIANLSRFVQGVELDLSEYAGTRPIELFGRTAFPTVGETPYFLSLGPHTFYWFALDPQNTGKTAVSHAGRNSVPSITIAYRENLLAWEGIREGIEALLPDYLRTRRWFGGKAKHIQSSSIIDVIPLTTPSPTSASYFVILGMEYVEGEPESYALPLTIAMGERAVELRNEFPHAVIARLQIKSKEESGVLIDGVWDSNFCEQVLSSIARDRRLRGQAGYLEGVPTRALRELQPRNQPLPEPAVLKGDQTNTSVLFGDRFILKLFRRLDAGTNPDLEIGRFLTEKQGLSSPAVIGHLDYRRGKSEPVTVGILHEFIPNQGDAWHYTLDELGRYFERAVAANAQLQEVPLPSGSLLDISEQPIPDLAAEMIGPYLESARLLGQRTAELHEALASARDDPRFVPEPFTRFYLQSLYQSMRTLSSQVLGILKRRLDRIPEVAHEEARQVLAAGGRISNDFRLVLAGAMRGTRIRCHGDYHLGQVLYTGKDFVPIDFEGEPARPLSVRKIKRSPVRDVAGMVRSFHYAVHSVLRDQEMLESDRAVLEPWGRFWYLWVSATFLNSYLERIKDLQVLPSDRGALETLLHVHLLEKAIYELGYELNNRPDWVEVPLRGILDLVSRKRPDGQQS